MSVLDWLRSLFARPTPVQPPAPPPLPMTLTPEHFAAVNARMIELHNEERKKYNLPPLAPDGRLAQSALDQAQYCARIDVMTHTGQGGSDVGQRVTARGYQWSRCAENAAQQPMAPANWPGADVRSPEWAVDGWIQSPGHKANMLGPYTQMGCGWADSASGTRYWICDFGRPS